MQKRLEVRSEISHSTPSRITVKGHDLCRDLIGHVSVGDMAFLEIMDRLPEERESMMFNALMVSLIEHGITPSSLAARMTIAGAPEAMQAAVAAGLTGLGSRFVGSMENAARMLQEGCPASGRFDAGETALGIVTAWRSDNRQIPGIGHGLHKPRDPRADRLLELAAELGFSGRFTATMTEIADVASQATGKVLPLNATGAIAAIACEMGIPWRLVRGIGVAARAIGLLGHIKEELENPMAFKIKAFVAAASNPEAD